MELEFEVTLYFDDSSIENQTVCVTANVSEDEFDALKDCYRDESEIEAYAGLEDLFDRLCDAAISEIDFDEDEDEDFSPEDLSFSADIEIPTEVADAADEEDFDCENYSGYPFAVEIVNYELISMTPDFQKELLRKLCEKLRWTEKELAEFLVSEDDDEDEEETWGNGLEFPIDTDKECIADVLGLDEDTLEFCRDGFGMFEGNGGAALELVKYLDIPIEEKIDYGTHGHGEYGIVYIKDFKKEE